MNEEEIKARDDVARQIRELKKKKAFTIDSLADKADISSVQLCDIYRENGDKFPSFKSMIRIFNALGLKEITIRWG